MHDGEMGNEDVTEVLWKASEDMYQYLHHLKHIAFPLSQLAASAEESVRDIC